MFSFIAWFISREAVQAKIDSLKEQAETFLRHQEKRKATACYKKILTLRNWQRDVQPSDLFEAHIKLGEIYAEQGNLIKSTTIFKRSLVLAEKKIGSISPEVATALGKLALVYDARAKIRASQEVRYNTDWDHVYWGSQVRTYWEGAYQRSEERARSLDYSERQQAIKVQLRDGRWQDRKRG